MSVKLPKNWGKAKLSEVALVIQGQSPPGHSYNTDGVGLPFLQGKAQFGSTSPTPDTWCSDPIRVAEASDILISIRAPVGPTNLADQRYCIGRGLAAIRTPEEISPSFLLYYLRHSVALLVDQAAGTTFDAIGGEVLRAHSVLVPPIAEQRRIVEAIDSYLTRLDDAVASLEKVLAKLKAYRASVLKAAIEGCLVPTDASLARAEKRAYEPAETLLARILKERRRRWEEAELAKMKATRRTPKDDKWRANYEEPEPTNTRGLPELPEGWTWARLEQVSDVQLGQQRAPVHANAEKQIPYIRAANITWSGLELNDVKEMGFPNPERYRLLYGDVLLSEASGSPMEAGKPAIWRDEIPGACYQKTLLRIRAIDARSLLPEYFRLVFLRDCVTGKFARLAPGVGIVHLTAERMRVWPIPLPPVPEQRRIVDEADRLESLATNVKSNTSAQLVRLQRLRQSVLKWAFGGKLVDQDPTDEPAERLLARIRDRRATAVPTKKSRSRTAKGAA